MSVADVISLLGGIALFLFGMSLMGEGLKKVAGSRLELVLYKLSSTPLKGVLLGTGVTAVIQSSSATSVMVVGFVNSGMMKVKQAIGVIMGAILGTSVTGWILCLSSLEGGSGVVQLLSTEVLTGIVAVVGIILRMFTGKTSNRYVGEILLGFAVLMYGMSAMSGAVSPLRESEAFIRILTSFSNPILGILVGLAFTSVLQSASAAVGILQALAITGAVTFEVALPIVMGIAIGAAVPVLLSALGANLNGKRTAFIYLLIDVLGVLIWALLFYGANAIIHFTFLDTVMSSVSIALMNTLFRLATVIVLLPCIGLMEHMVELLFPDDGSAAEEQEMDRLEERFLQHPALSIEQSRLVTNSMAERAEGNLLMAVGLRNRWSDKDFRMVGETESVIDRYEDKLGTYLMKITSKSLSQSQSEEVSKYLHTISDFERISDHALNISEAAKEIHDKDLQFSPEACHELDVIESAVREILSIAVGAFVENDPQRAARVEPLEEIIDGLCDEMKSHHVDRLQSGSCTLNQGFVFNDLLTNYERVADHCSNIAVAIIELESDSFDTHEYLNSVRAMKSSSFARYYEEYKQEYHL
ncbi:MAG: Na/Pi cotransporter family protein [Clostridiales bacterium]|jgi:phosphate:Na+ symporter|nr:Na/Pi cotransporter family protein [Clostridiales bacterium]